MKKTLLLALVILGWQYTTQGQEKGKGEGFADKQKQMQQPRQKGQALSAKNVELKPTTGYAPVNGLIMYYEIYEPTRDTGSTKKPLVLIHGGGSTISTSFGKMLRPLSRNRQVIAVELQAHGHTADIKRPLSFEQDADDVAALLKNLGVDKADFFGFSNGGTTALQVAIRHPHMVRKLVVASAMFKRDGMYPQFWEFMQKATLADMPEELKKAYLEVAPKPEDLQAMHDKCAARMLAFQDWEPEAIQSITAPTLVMTGDEDVVRPEHAVEMYRLLPEAQLAIFPSSGHGSFLGEATTRTRGDNVPRFVAMTIEDFLNEPTKEEEEEQGTGKPETDKQETR